MISDFLGVTFDPRPPISDFPPILKAFLHRDSPIFENLPPSLESDIIHGWPLRKKDFIHVLTALEPR